MQKLTYLSPESQSSSDDEWEPEILKEPRITDDDDVPSGSGKHFSIHLFLNLEIFLWTEHAILEHSLSILGEAICKIDTNTIGEFRPYCYAYHSL